MQLLYYFKHLVLKVSINTFDNPTPDLGFMSRREWIEDFIFSGWCLSGTLLWLVEVVPAAPEEDYRHCLGLDKKLLCTNHWRVNIHKIHLSPIRLEGLHQHKCRNKREETAFVVVITSSRLSKLSHQTERESREGNLGKDEEKLMEKAKNEQQEGECSFERSHAVQSGAVLPAVSVGAYLCVISCPPAVTQTGGSPLWHHTDWQLTPVLCNCAYIFLQEDIDRHPAAWSGECPRVCVWVCMCLQETLIPNDSRRSLLSVSYSLSVSPPAVSLSLPDELLLWYLWSYESYFYLCVVVFLMPGISHLWQVLVHECKKHK